MPAARNYLSAFLLLVAPPGCAPDTTGPQVDSGPPFDAAFGDGVLEDWSGDLMATEPSPDARRTGLDQRPHNASCLAPPTPEAMPMHLGDTGCFDPNDL